MKSQMGLVMNIVLGIIGAAVASWLFGMLGLSLGGGWVGYLIAGFIGACILIFDARAIRGATALCRIVTSSLQRWAKGLPLEQS
jgi:uncharacterized membrane protein YeaQ/YmgE (transglycosylase-associated protein family)